MAVGYLPGHRDPLSGAYKVRRDDAHAWAEVYFADHGWVPFDSSPRGELLSQGGGGSSVGFMLQAGAGEAVFGAVKSAPTRLISAATEALRNPVFAIVVLLAFLIAIVLRWAYSRSGKSAARWRVPLTYKDNLSGEDRRQLLKLYGQLEKLLQRKSGMRRKSWQTVAGFTKLTTSADPWVQSQVSWLTRAVWYAAYDPKQLPAGLVEEARQRLLQLRRSFKAGNPALIQRA